MKETEWHLRDWLRGKHACISVAYWDRQFFFFFFFYQIVADKTFVFRSIIYPRWFLRKVVLYVYIFGNSKYHSHFHSNSIAKVKLLYWSSIYLVKGRSLSSVEGGRQIIYYLRIDLNQNRLWPYWKSDFSKTKTKKKKKKKKAQPAVLTWSNFENASTQGTDCCWDAFWRHDHSWSGIMLSGGWNSTSNFQEIILNVTFSILYKTSPFLLTVKVVPWAIMTLILVWQMI